jgi:hypothetical protein
LQADHILEVTSLDKDSLRHLENKKIE